MMKRPEEVDFSDSDSEDMELDEDDDEALQEAFAAGKLKPGLVVFNKGKLQDGMQMEDKPKVINDVPMLKLQIEKIKLPKKFGWIERLDIVNDEAPLAPEIALQLNEHKNKKETSIKKGVNNKKKKAKGPSTSTSNVEDDPVHNDFVREMGFYRQGQEAVLKCIPKLKEMGIPTKRPDDYFAEMAKSDVHMQKVAQVLLKKQTATEKAEKVRKLREQKKFAKQTQVQVLQERQKAKKEMIESVKKYRKDKKGSLDFLDEKKSGGGRGKGNPNPKGGGGGDKRINKRRQLKNDKYGYGGKKKGAKWNTRDSLDSFGEGGSSGGGKKGPKAFGRGGGKPMGRGRGKMGGDGGGSLRPGKSQRQKIKAGRRK